jgi:hypothetical protein
VCVRTISISTSKLCKQSCSRRIIRCCDRILLRQHRQHTTYTHRQQMMIEHCLPLIHVHQIRVTITIAHLEFATNVSLAPITRRVTNTSTHQQPHYLEFSFVRFVDCFVRLNLQHQTADHLRELLRAQKSRRGKQSVSTAVESNNCFCISAKFCEACAKRASHVR